jgi:cobalt/nickel transport system ATP-binding protein
MAKEREGKKILEFQGITAGYNGHIVLENVNLSVHERDFIGVVGANGSGKTTLFHLLMGLLRPTQGEIVVFGKTRLQEKDFREVREKIGLLFQDADDQLFCPTVAEDVAFGPLNLGKSQEEALEITRQVLKRLSLEEFENRLTYKLSGGEKRLISLATVLAMQPEVLVLDEPTTGLDEDTVERLIHILSSSDLTYLIASHNRDFLSKTTDIVYHLGRGKLAKAT